MRQVPYFEVGWDSLKPGSTPLSSSLLSWTLHRLNIPPNIATKLCLLPSVFSGVCLHPFCNPCNWRENHTSYRAGVFHPIKTPPPKPVWCPSFSTALEAQKFGQLDLAPSHPILQQRPQSVCNHTFKVNKNHHRPTEPRHVSSSSPVGTEIRPSPPLATRYIAPPPPPSFLPLLPPTVVFSQAPTSIPRPQDHAE
jgi:hypothetical protein